VFLVLIKPANPQNPHGFWFIYFLENMIKSMRDLRGCGFYQALANQRSAGLFAC
jgi:hypothetical protein